MGLEENLDRKQNTRDWFKGIIVPIYRKGGKKQCGSCRGITLFRIYERVLVKKLCWI
jgi:hypothetical protein